MGSKSHERGFPVLAVIKKQTNKQISSKNIHIPKFEVGLQDLAGRVMTSRVFMKSSI